MQISSMGGSSLAEMLQQMQQKMQTNFSKADTDGDGALSKTEFSAFDEAMKAGAPGGISGNEPTADDMFSKMDTDGDGTVTMAEIQANAPPPPPIDADGMSALLQMQEADGSGTNPILEAFKAADADGDGVLSETEFAAFDEAMKAQGPGAGSATDTDTANAATDDTTQTAAAGGGGGGGGGGKTFDALDTNQDGYVSAEELAAANNPMSSTGTGDLMTSLIQRLLANYTQNGDDALSSLLGTEA